MVTLLKNLNSRTIAVELPTFLSAMLVAEYLFKFHSFTLECLSFLALWAALSSLAQHFVKK